MRKHVNPENGDVSLMWDSLTDLLEDQVRISKGPNAENWSRDNTNNRYGYGYDWYGTRTLLEFKEKFVYGWPELLESMHRKLAPIRDATMQYEGTVATVKKRRRVSGDHGDRIDMDQVYQGNVDQAWSRMQQSLETSRTKKIITLFLDMSTSASVTSSNIEWRTAATIRIAELLQRMGYGVQVYAGTISGAGIFVGNWKSKLFTAVKLKDSLMPLDIENIAMCSTAGFYRVYGFSMYCGDARVNSSYGPIGKFGLPHELENPDLNTVKMKQCFSEESAISAVHEILTTLGVSTDNRQGVFA